jgi:hypothetical protein
MTWAVAAPPPLFDPLTRRLILLLPAAFRHTSWAS